MSHLKERQENNCLNCNARVLGRYCQLCGQENIEPKESAWHLVNHFFQDITHFDGKFFSTLWLLITRPGFLSAAYSRGRRASYLNPIRMYIFTSAFFFLLFFSFFSGDDVLLQGTTVNGKTFKQAAEMDAAAFAEYTMQINREEHRVAVPMSRLEFKSYYDSVVNSSTDSALRFTPGSYSTKEEYDSLLRSGVKKHNWLERKLTYRQIEINEKYRGHASDAIKTISEAFLHKLPQLLFVSLPLLALLLKLLYIRHKEFYYVSHGIFSLHLYIFVFIALLFFMSLGKINDSVHWGFIITLRGLLLLSMFFYLYKAMRNFYQQRRAKTILKFMLLVFSFLITMVILFVFFIFFSFLSI